MTSYLAAWHSSDGVNPSHFPRKTQLSLFPSVSFDLGSYWKLSEMILFATQGVSLQGEEFQSSHKWRTKLLSYLGSSLWGGTKNKRTTPANRLGLNGVISPESGVKVILDLSYLLLWSLAKIPREESHQFTPSNHRCCSREGSGTGLRKSLQSNSTLSSNNFISLVGMPKGT